MSWCCIILWFKIKTNKAQNPCILKLSEQNHLLHHPLGFSARLNSSRFALCPLAQSSENLMRPVKYVSWIYCSRRWERHLGCDFKPHAPFKWGNHSWFKHAGVFKCACVWAKRRKPFLKSYRSPNYAKRLSFRADCGPRLIDGCSYAVDFIHSENYSCKKKTVDLKCLSFFIQLQRSTTLRKVMPCSPDGVCWSGI